MTRFVARVELNGPPPRTTYVTLHDALSNAGFHRYIDGTDGNIYKLPDGTYVGILNTTDEFAALDYVKNVVSSVHHNAEVAIFMYTNSAWIGLQRVN